MPSKDLGEITFIPCGEWREDVTYQRLSIVSVDGSSYCAKRKNKGERPAAASAYWQLIASRGAQGQDGKQGEDGAPGKGLQILGTVATVAALPSTAEQGDMYNVGTAEPYTVYMYDNGTWVSQGQLRGSDGITPTIGYNGNWYLGTTDTEKPSRGETGAKGDTGAAAGFGTVTATVDNNVGTPEVNVTTSGSATAKNFTFKFKNIKGDKGDKGSTGEQGIQGIPGEKGEPGNGFVIKGYYASLAALQAAVTSPEAGDAYGVGSAAPYDIYVYDGVAGAWVNNGALQGAPGADGITPTIGDNGNWYLGTTDTGLPSRGAAGAPGAAGKDGTNGTNGKDGAAAGFGTVTVTVDNNTGTPEATVTTSGTDAAKNFAFAFKNLKGAKGDKGATGADGADGDPGVYIGSTEPTDESVQVWIDPNGAGEKPLRLDTPQTNTEAQKAQGRSNLGAQAKITTASITLPVASWTGDDPYTQTVTISGVTAKSRIDLNPSAAVLAAAMEGGYGLVIGNNNGTVTVYAVGAKPTAAITVQVSIAEVN